ncbi:hypothetical protein ACLOJK_003215, partial [Asimina triloba]
TREVTKKQEIMTDANKVGCKRTGRGARDRRWVIDGQHRKANFKFLRRLDNIGN